MEPFGSETSSHQRKRRDNDLQPTFSHKVSGGQQTTDFSEVNDRLEEFLRCFVEKFEAKLHIYHLILERQVKKSGKCTEKFSKMAGQAVFGVASAGIEYVLPADEEKYGAKVEKKIGGYIGSKIGSENYKGKVTNLTDLVNSYQTDKTNFRLLLVETAFDVFQSLEMQFQRVTTDLGPKEAIKLLAKEAVNRAINGMETIKDISLNKSIIQSKSERKPPYSFRFGFQIQYEYQLSKMVWKTASVFDKVGVVIENETSPKYYKKKEEKNKTSKYGYRRLLVQENWNELKENYDVDNILESKSVQFTDYQYLLCPSELEEQSKNILQNLNSKGNNLEKNRYLKIFDEEKKDISDIIGVLIGQSCENHDNCMILASIEAIVKNLQVEEYFNKSDLVDEIMLDQLQYKRTIESVWFDVREPTSLFTGRVQELYKLHSTLLRNQEKPTVISQMTVISGLGGMGKTQLARRYIEKKIKDFYDNVIWLNAESELTLLNSCNRLAKDELNIKLDDANGKEKGIKYVMEEVYQLLKETKSLVIFDNAVNGEYLKQFLPQRFLPQFVKKPYILITSRNREWEKGIEVIDLNELTLEDAVEFVKKGLSITNKFQDQKIQNLVDKLQRFPLAIQQTIAYIKDQQIMGEFTIDDYLQEYEKKTTYLLNSKVFMGICNDYAKTTFTTWNATIDKILSDEEHGKLALDILNIMAYLAPGNINTEIFLSLAGNDKKKLKSSVRLLVKYSMVNSEEKQSASVSIYRLVQDVIRIGLKQQNKEENIVNESFKLLKENYDYSSDKVNDHDKQRKLLPHLEELLSHIQYIHG